MRAESSGGTLRVREDRTALILRAEFELEPYRTRPQAKNCRAGCHIFADRAGLAEIGLCAGDPRGAAANRSGFSEVGSTVLGGAVSVVKLLQILCQAQVLLKVGQRLTSPGFQFGVLAAF